MTHAFPITASAPAYARQINRPQPSQHWDIAAVTGPLDILAGRQVLVLSDIENLTYSARNRLGYKVSYRALGARLSALTASCTCHAFFSRAPGRDDPWSRYFAERGWIPHARDIEVISTRLGPRRLANADNLILFSAGLIISRHSADVVVLASGDGALVCDLARAIAGLPKPRRVVTLSLAGSTSQRLDAERNTHIAANIEIGRDCLRPL